MKFLFFVSVLLSSATAFAAEFDPKEYEIKSVSIQEVQPTFLELLPINIGWKQSNTPSGMENLDWQQIVLIGEKLIELIKQGAPVVNVTRSAVFAVPAGISNWQQLDSWQPLPATKVFQVKMVNAYNMNMVDVRLKVSAMYGGGLDGHGKYLANVIIVPTMINVKWGVTLDVWSENRDPINIGSVADPVAGLGFDIRYRVKTWVTAIEGSQDYMVTGRGEILQTAN